jgi:hypothetical protein
MSLTTSELFQNFLRTSSGLRVRRASMLRAQRVLHSTPTHWLGEEYTIALPADPPNLLSVHRTFVVQLYADADIDAGRVAGRVEHVVSGQATHFSSLEALLAFLARILRGGHSAP